MSEVSDLRPRRSSSVAKLALAMSKAQGQFESVEKSGEGTYGKYGTLAATWDAIRKPLADNEIFVYQRIFRDGPVPVMATMLIHSSGEFIDDCEIELKAESNNRMNPMQAMGSAITYARRYSLQAVIGIAPDDDDDGEGSGTSKTAAKPQKSSNSGAKIETKPIVAMATDEQMSQLYDLVAAREVSDQAMIDLITASGGDATKPLSAPIVIAIIGLLTPKEANEATVRAKIAGLKAPKQRPIAIKTEPADYVLPFGEGIKGKRLGELTYEVLLQLKAWCENAKKVTPPVKNIGEVLEVLGKVSAQLKHLDAAFTLPIEGES